MSAPKLKTIKPASTVKEIEMQDASLDIWDKKYRLKDKESNPVDADINATYERYILEDPANWFWVHNRWKRSDRAKKRGNRLAASQK